MPGDITSVEDIPTLSQLYAKSEIPKPDAASKYKPDSKLNDRISIWRGNIVQLKVNVPLTPSLCRPSCDPYVMMALRVVAIADMIVNAANKSLLGGGGVDGAIHRAAGKELLRECETLGGAETGETKVTKGYNLPSRYVAHTVGPVYAKTKVAQKAQQLESCYRTSLESCKQLGGGSIGFSSISTGIYGYPIVDATRIALETTRKFLESDESISRVIYVVFSERDESVYKQCVGEFFPNASA
ncbi:hypothetical protein DB88DRAFT_470251 [Papiliotrema laurentii]|uniref:Macro domain-containing protein n=1 Tax=Papiliotrema laurentii TaxID=5418 RepID=A0AAD9FWN7_PAPLA|nr:hypothetical protein DB88DRAFT_470251 [Papiliotrema laurentii]